MKTAMAVEMEEEMEMGEFHQEEIMPSVALMSGLDLELAARWFQPNSGVVVVRILIRAPYLQELDQEGPIEQVAANLGYDQIPSQTVFFEC